MIPMYPPCKELLTLAHIEYVSGQSGTSMEPGTLHPVGEERETLGDHSWAKIGARKTT